MKTTSSCERIRLGVVLAGQVVLGVSLLLACGGRSLAGPSGPGTVEPAPRTLAVDRHFEVLSAAEGPGAARLRLTEAGHGLGDWTIYVAGVAIDGPLLLEMAAADGDEPIVRVVRERLGRAVDLDDFLYFLDDVLAAGDRGLRGQSVWLTSGRARGAGVLVHPDDVYGTGPARVYGAARKPISIEQPKEQTVYPIALDGEELGPNWTMRYRNPDGEKAMLAALRARREGSGFADRLANLIAQLRAQGADVWLNSTTRSPERGYLMWGAFVLSRAEDEVELSERLGELERANVEWGLQVPIRWRHADGWRATKSAAQRMADTYDVVFATRQGARSSSHYGGHAVDLSAVNLPRTLRLEAPDGASRSFDLSGADEPRDLSVSPTLVDWIEIHFGLEKLRADYPHWNDVEVPSLHESRNRSL